MERQSVETGLAILVMGFLTTLGMILWPFLVSLGILYTVSIWGVFGFLLFTTASIWLSYYLNEARKHGGLETYDDRLTVERMDEACRWLIASAVVKAEESK